MQCRHKTRHFLANGNPIQGAASHRRAALAGRGRFVSICIEVFAAGWADNVRYLVSKSSMIGELSAVLVDSMAAAKAVRLSNLEVTGSACDSPIRLPRLGGELDDVARLVLLTALNAEGPLRPCRLRVALHGTAVSI